MEELRLLTGLSFRKLITHINAAQQRKVKSIDDETVYYFDTRSCSALYRESQKEQTKQISELAGTQLKKDEGQVRIKMIEIPIYYEKNPEQRCELKEVESYEILRWLCFYEVKTRYLSHTRIYTNNNPTLGFIMNEIMSIQNQLKIPIKNITLFAQKILKDKYDDRLILCWDWVSSSIFPKSWLYSEDQKLINIELLDHHVRKHSFSLNGLE